MPRLLLILLLPWFAQHSIRAEAAQGTGLEKAPAYREDRLLVRAKGGVSPRKISDFHSANHCEVIQRFPGLDDLQVLRVPPGGTVAECLSKYRSSVLVEYAEPDYRVRLAGAFPNDPKFLDGTLWGLNNAGQNGGKPNADIDAPEAWAVWPSASNIVVAVVDTGVRYTHEDLAANIWVNPEDGSHGTNAVVGTSDPQDDNGHGTRIAGIIGAAGNNGTGVVGVAWQVQIMACKFADASGFGSVSDAIACLEFARIHGAQIVNASWGIDYFSLSLSNAVLAARSAGIIVAAAAGNDSQDNDLFPFYPASFDLDNIVAVAATTRADALYSLSNFGATSVHLAAPGYQIYSTSSESDDAYAFDEGTSMAAGFVSGSLALLRARFPSDLHAHLIHRLLEAADPVANLAGLCATGGRLDLRRALGIPLSPPLLQALYAGSGEAPQLRVQGDPGRTYVIEACGDFAAWTPISTNISDFNGAFVFKENPPPNATPRFYRALTAD